MTTSTPTQGFIIDADPQLDWPVTVRMPATGGGFVDRRFTARFRVLSEEGHKALFSSPDAAKAGGQEGAEKAEAEKELVLSEVLQDNAERLPKIVVGWGEDVTDPQGRPVPFSVSTLQALITGPHGAAISKGFWQAVNEIRYGLAPAGGASLGNSAPPSATGSDSTAGAVTS
ncbi:MAG TPA: hypothetical protein VJ576_02580 [Rhodocyclaceae bacterium]|nr:hypothetical protein [Rhodocyclaceae bacterium]